MCGLGGDGVGRSERDAESGTLLGASVGVGVRTDTVGPSNCMEAARTNFRAKSIRDVSF